VLELGRVEDSDRSSALDVGFSAGPGRIPHVWPPHGELQQLWNLRPSGKADEEAA
jgi:hypothetical protein